MDISKDVLKLKINNNHVEMFNSAYAGCMGRGR